MIPIGNAPCSWGTLEFAGLDGERLGYQQMLDELRETGYTGTDLGDWGFMPTDPAALQAALLARNLAMVSAFVPVALSDASAHRQGIAEALKVARLLAAAPGTNRHAPLIVLADANGTDPLRTSHAGRIDAGGGLAPAAWRTFAGGAEAVARAVYDATGLHTVFHHHCAGFIETPTEMMRLLELTDPHLLGLVFDTGHLVYGSGANDGAIVTTTLPQVFERVKLVHFKDCHPTIAATARANKANYFEAVARGVFCELGQGCVPFADVAAYLREHDYRGWITVEQDVLPGMGRPHESARRNREYVRTLGL